jgi:AI-2 transport system permease protein
MVVLIIAAAGAWTLSRTAFGRDFYAVGDNLAAARQLGVAVNRTRMIAFTLNGMLAACAGIVFAAQIGFVPNQTGSGLEMKAIAACVLGGISLLGGTGTLIGACSGLSSSPKSTPCWCCSGCRPGGTTLSPGWCCWAYWCSTGGRQALARHQRALKYGRFQPGNRGESTSPPFPNAKKRWRK